MGATRHYTVLVLDDTPAVLKAIEARIQGDRVPGQLDPAMPVDVKAIPVSLRPDPTSPGSWVFSEATGRALAAACERPPDLILVDFGFADPDLTSRLREEAATRRIAAEELTGKVLTAHDLARWCRQDLQLDPIIRSRLVANLFESGRPVCLYSYSSREFRDALGSMDMRAKRIQDAFPRSKVSVIDARGELYDGDSFDTPPTSKHDPGFFAYQISVILDYTVQKEILRSLLRRSRFLRVRRTAGAVAALAAIGSALGLAGHWAGGLVLGLFSRGETTAAVAVTVGMLLSLFLFGFLATLTFERMMEHLLPDEDVSR